jgi:hypothetical protein
MTWYLNNEEFTSENIGDSIGFVYRITNKTNGMKYLGKKLFVSTNRLPPLKGKTRKRIVKKESDWKTYFGSSEEVKMLVEQLGVDAFHREILHLCKSKGEMSYIEAKLQFQYDVLLRDDYYNGIIQCKIHRTHAKSLKFMLDNIV